MACWTNISVYRRGGGRRSSCGVCLDQFRNGAGLARRRFRQRADKNPSFLEDFYRKLKRWRGGFCLNRAKMRLFYSQLFRKNNLADFVRIAPCS